MLPEKFIEYASRYPQLQGLPHALATEPVTSVRFNKRKGDPTVFAFPLGEKVAWCDSGYYLEQRPKFTFDPAMHQGLYYVQDASSMAIAAAIKQIAGDEPIAYLDACAAPGGKTTAAIDALPDGSLVVANEYDFKRAEILAENIAKWGYPCAMVARGDTKKISKLAGVFDIVSVDAPCSGEGMMRKDKQAVEQWSPTLVRSCAATQRQIIENVWPAIKPGGYLIYSTCTFNREENEENLQWIIDNFDARTLPIQALDACPEIERGIDTPLHCYRFIPGKAKGEGLFLALLQKGGAPQTPQRPKQKPAKPCPQAAQWIADGEKWTTLQQADQLVALPPQWAPLMQEIAKKLDAISMGVTLGTIKGKDLVPDQALALSTALAPNAFPTCEVGYDDAIAFLQRQALALADAPKGYVLLTYQGVPLGFVKNLGNRANNLYPKAWRVLSSLH